MGARTGLFDVGAMDLPAYSPDGAAPESVRALAALRAHSSPPPAGVGAPALHEAAAFPVY
jgi:hypothetical protein